MPQILFAATAEGGGSVGSPSLHPHSGGRRLLGVLDVGCLGHHERDGLSLLAESLDADLDDRAAPYPVVTAVFAIVPLDTLSGKTQSPQ